MVRRVYARYVMCTGAAAAEVNSLQLCESHHRVAQARRLVSSDSHTWCGSLATENRPGWQNFRNQNRRVHCPRRRRRDYSIIRVIENFVDLIIIHHNNII